MTRGELVAELAAMLGARHEARFIVQEVASPTGTDVSPIDPTSIERARAMAERRCNGEPLQYVLGHWAFRTLDLVVDSRVLIPRPETEQLVDVALAELLALGSSAPTIVDAGTGSGAIALSLAVELAATHPNARVWAVDASSDALEVAAMNLARLTPRVLPVSLVHGEWLDCLPPEMIGSVDMVVSNPPYIDVSEWDGLPKDVRHEPRAALLAPPASDGTPGLRDVEAVLVQSQRWLTHPGVVVLELAPDQAEAAIRLAAALGFIEPRVEPDLAGLPRALVARLAGTR